MRVPKESRTLHCLNFSQGPRKAAFRFSHPSKWGQKGKGRDGELKVISHQPSKTESFCIMKPLMPTTVIQLNPLLFVLALP